VDGWVKSSFSASGNCLEAASTGGGVAIRNNDRLEDGVLLFAAGEWRAFLDGVKAGESTALG
jgi:hypothetical protein